MQKLVLFLIMQLIFCSRIFAGDSLDITLNDPSDLTKTKQKRLVLITGCGRSGTTYMTEFLRKSGLDVLHEQMGRDGSVSWIMGAETDWAPVGPLLKNFEFDHIFHQVRHPLKVIRSYYNSPPGVTWEWICSIIPEISLEDSPLTRCAKYWYYWNLMIENKAEWTYRIEDFAEKYQELGERLGLVFEEEVLMAVPTDVNTRVKPGHISINWNYLKKNVDRKVYLQVRRLAKRYGYLKSNQSMVVQN